MMMQWRRFGFLRRSIRKEGVTCDYMKQPIVTTWSLAVTSMNRLFKAKTQVLLHDGYDWYTLAYYPRDPKQPVTSLYYEAAKLPSMYLQYAFRNDRRRRVQLAPSAFYLKDAETHRYLVPESMGGTWTKQALPPKVLVELGSDAEELKSLSDTLQHDVFIPDGHGGRYTRAVFTPAERVKQQRMQELEERLKTEWQHHREGDPWRFTMPKAYDKRIDRSTARI